MQHRFNFFETWHTLSVTIFQSLKACSSMQVYARVTLTALKNKVHIF